MRYLLIYLVLTVSSHAVNSDSADNDYHEWQLQKLLDPTPWELALEDAGRVYIYDGLKDSDIEYAMDAQFDRIAHMMFVRTVVTDDSDRPLRDQITGNFVVEDDDCD